MVSGILAFPPRSYMHPLLPMRVTRPAHIILFDIMLGRSQQLPQQPFTERVRLREASSHRQVLGTHYRSLPVQSPPCVPASGTPLSKFMTRGPPRGCNWSPGLCRRGRGASGTSDLRRARTYCGSAHRMRALFKCGTMGGGRTGT